MDGQAGVKALSWYLKSGHHERAESIDVGLIATMSFCIVGEGLSYAWWEMMQSEHLTQSFGAAANLDRDQTRIMTHRRHNALLRSLVETQAYWTTEPNMFNEQLESFLTAWRTGIPTSGAYCWLVGNMPHIDKTGIDIASHDEFLKTTANYRLGDVVQSYLDKGYVELMHPTRPDPSRLLEFFCYPACEPERLEAPEKASHLRIEFVVKRLAQHCNNAGYPADARAVIDSAMDILHRKRPSSSPATGGKFFKRRATENEREQGIRVDEEGYVLPISLVTELEAKGRKSLYRFK